ncbi:hypothetical protein ABQF47_16360, partial [Mycolicibacter sinensis]
MTNTPNTETPAPEEGVDTTPTTGTPEVSESEPTSPNREAANYRRRLRDTEAERDTLAQRLESLQRNEIERLAGQHLENGADLWHGGSIKVSDLLNDVGEVDPDLVTGAAHILLASRPHWVKRASVTESTSTVNSNDLVEGGGSPP